MRSPIIDLDTVGPLWRTPRDSNPEPPVLETGALPIELGAHAQGDRGPLLPSLF